MGLIKWFLEKKRHDRERDEEWDELSYEWDELNIHDPKQRQEYLEECLKQLGDASKEIEVLAGEYNLVTTYLTDMEQIEQLPESEYHALCELCSKLVRLGEERTSFQERQSRMPDEQYKNILRKEQEVEEGIKKIEEAEGYRTLIKQDFKRLDSEKSAYHYRRNELENELANLKGMAGIILGAIAFCFLLLLVLQLGLDFDTRLGYLLAGALAAIVITVIYFKYMEADRELSKVHTALNRLVQLHNTVKIRYVNNTSLLEYLYMKYGVESGSKLRKLWEQYQIEKEERKKYRHAELELEQYEEEFLERLERYNVKQPKRWLNQAAAILDHKEMVEIRHELIIRRQALRKRMDYNRDIAKAAKEDIMDLAKTYPQYAAEIQNMVDRYEKMY